MVQQPAPVTPGQPSRRRLALRRTIAAVVLLALLALGGWGAASALRSVRDPDPPPPVTRALPHPKPLRIIFPEGFTRAEMADRITAVNGIARSKRHVRTKLSARAYTRLTASSRLPGKFAGDRKRRTLEGFLFPATYQFLPKTTTRELVDDQLEAFRRSWKKVGLRYARSKKLTPYDVLIIASMIEKETAAPSERRLVAAVIYTPSRTAADADREPGLGLDAGGGAPGEGRLPLLRPQAGQGAPLFHGERIQVSRVPRPAWIWRLTPQVDATAGGRPKASGRRRGRRGRRRSAFRCPGVGASASTGRL